MNDFSLVPVNLPPQDKALALAALFLIVNFLFEINDLNSVLLVEFQTFRWKCTEQGWFQSTILSLLIPMITRRERKRKTEKFQSLVSFSLIRMCAIFNKNNYSNPCPCEEEVCDDLSLNIFL